MKNSILLLPSPDFILLAGTWCNDQSAIILDFVWEAYKLLLMDSPHINTRDLERSITQLLEARIHKVMSGDEPFYVQHGPYERETMKKSPAQPPQYDIAFILNADERIMWPLEAKVLETEGTIRDYVVDLQNEFLKCRYAPFSSEGAMLGYLLSGLPSNVFANIAKKVPCKLVNHPKFPSLSQKVSSHNRIVPRRKAYPIQFQCHHLLLEFFKIKRTK